MTCTAFFDSPRSADVIVRGLAPRSPSPTTSLAARSAASLSSHAFFASRSASRLRRSSASAADLGASRLEASAPFVLFRASASASSRSSISNLAASSAAILSQSKRVRRGASGASFVSESVRSLAAMIARSRARRRRRRCDVDRCPLVESAEPWLDRSVGAVGARDECYLGIAEAVVLARGRAIELTRRDARAVGRRGRIPRIVQTPTRPRARAPNPHKSRRRRRRPALR